MYDIRGYLVVYFRLSMKKMNTTVVSLQPSLEFPYEAIMREATQLTSCIADVVVCIILLLPLVITGMSEPSIPYYSVDLKWFVPCPKPISMVDRFLTLFDASVWLKMITVFVLGISIVMVFSRLTRPNCSN
jgi:hypothetical protein